MSSKTQPPHVVLAGYVLYKIDGDVRQYGSNRHGRSGGWVDEKVCLKSVAVYPDVLMPGHGTYPA